jgi:hypothetical protein
VEEKQFRAIVSKLDILIRIVALSNTKGLTSTDKISLLNQAGLAPKNIAEIIGTSQNVVNVRLSQMRRKEGKNGKEKRD